MFDTKLVQKYLSGSGRAGDEAEYIGKEYFKDKDNVIPYMAIACAILKNVKNWQQLQNLCGRVMDPFQFSNKYYGFSLDILREDTQYSKTYRKMLAEKLVNFLSNPALELPIRYTLEDFLVYFQIKSQKTQDRIVEKRKFLFFRTPLILGIYIMGCRF